MKKILAFIFVMLMVISFSACIVDKENADVTTGAPTGTENPSTITEEPTTTETIPLDYSPADYVGFFDPYFDYAFAPQYKVQFMGLADSTYYLKINEALSHWASKMNLNYGEIWGAGGDTVLFVDKIEEFAQQGTDGFLLDSGPIYPRINELLTELDIPWMSCSTAPRDYEQESAPLLHPYVKIDGYTIGVNMMNRLFELKDDLWPDASNEEIGIITGEYTSSMPPLRDYQRGTYDTWMEKTSLDTHYFTADNSVYRGGGILDLDASPLNIRYIIKHNPEIKYWLFAAQHSFFAEFALDVLDELGLNDSGCVVSTSVGFALDPLRNQWDSGEQIAWRGSEYIPDIIYTEPVVGALYAYMSGQATPETIWPQWVDANDFGGEGDTYAGLIVPSYWVDLDNYKRIMKWTDVYAGTNFFPEYPADGIIPKSYNARAEVPAYYSTKAQDDLS